MCSRVSAGKGRSTPDWLAVHGWHGSSVVPKQPVQEQSEQEKPAVFHEWTRGWFRTHHRLTSHDDRLEIPPAVTADDGGILNRLRAEWARLHSDSPAPVMVCCSLVVGLLYGVTARHSRSRSTTKSHPIGPQVGIVPTSQGRRNVGRSDPKASQPQAIKNPTSSKSSSVSGASAAISAL